LVKEVLFVWKREQQQAFKKLKQIISTISVLVYLDFNKPFILYMNISKEGLGVILVQKEQDNKIHLVIFISYKNV